MPAGAELAPAATFQPALTVPQTPPDGMKTIARPAPRPQSAKARASATAVERLPARPSSAHTNRGPESTGEIDIDFDEGVGRMVAGLVERADEGSAEAAAALDAMQSFRLAEAALQRNDVSSAQKFAQMAVHCDASQSDYVTLLAWIRSLSGSAQALTEAINTMSNVLNDDPSNERALLYRGKLFVRAERLAEAAVDLRALLAQNPQHRDAAAELRQLTSKIG